MHVRWRVLAAGYGRGWRTDEIGLDSTRAALPAGRARGGAGGPVPPGARLAAAPADRRRAGRGRAGDDRPVGPLGRAAAGPDRRRPADAAAGRPGGGRLGARGRPVVAAGRDGRGPGPRRAWTTSGAAGFADRAGAARRVGPPPRRGRPGRRRDAPRHRAGLPGARRPRRPWPSRPGVPPIDWRPFGPETEAEFRAVLQQTYIRSLDMPELEGIRSLDDILASHRAAGRFVADRWRMGLVRGDPRRRRRCCCCRRSPTATPGRWPTSA